VARLSGLLVRFHERDQQARVFPAEGSDFRTEGRELFRDAGRHAAIIPKPCQKINVYRGVRSVVIVSFGSQ
jgi:hypothetical protein